MSSLPLSHVSAASSTTHRASWGEAGDIARVRRSVETLAALSVRMTAVMFPLVVATGAALGSYFTLAGVFVVFVQLSVTELVLMWTGVGARQRIGEPDVALVDRGAPAQLRFYAVLHLLAFGYVTWRVAAGRHSTLELLGVGASLACMGGTVGGLGGHELFHKRGKVDRVLGIALYATASYAHFAGGHIGGHHVNVGRHHDWGTARRGETIYHFLYRAVVHGFVGAWRIDVARHRRLGRSPWSASSFVVRCVTFTLALWAFLFAVGGAKTLAFFLAVSVLTIAFMELFNYISHYALVRGNGDGVESSASELTWESDNKVVNWFIWNAGRHCHHHERPAHDFERLTLEHTKEAIPHGIALMAIVSFVPPLYLRKMESILAKRAPCESPDSVVRSGQHHPR